MVMTRRQFLRNSGLGLASALVVPSFLEGCIEPFEPYPTPLARNDYRMAFVVVKSDSDASSGQAKLLAESAQSLAIEFPKKFSAETKGRVTVDIDSEIYILNWNARGVDDLPGVLNAVESFNLNFNQDDSFDFVTIVPAFDYNKVAEHLNIFNTSNRINNNPYPDGSYYINSRRIIGINVLGTLSLDVLLEELAHQWSAYIKKYSLTEGIRKDHFNGSLTNLVDVTNEGIYIPLGRENQGDGGVFWEQINDNEYKLHHENYVNLGFETKLLSTHPYSELTLWAMGALELDELTSKYLCLDYNFIKKGYYELPAKGTIVTGRMVSSREILLNHLIDKR